METDAKGPLPKNQESPKLKLPKTPETINKLRDKLTCYRDILSTDKALHEIGMGKKLSPFLAPEQAFQVFPNINNNHYIVYILEKLLAEGVVDTQACSRDLAAKDYGSFDAQAFNHACAEIDALIAET